MDVVIVVPLHRMSTGTSGRPIVPWDSMGHPTSPRSGIHTWSLLSILSHSSMVPWDPMEHPTSPWSGLGLGVGLLGYPMGSQGTMGL